MASGEERQSSLRALQRMFVDDKLMNNFLIGRDFYDRHHSFLKSQFFECHSIMRDAFLACALAWAAGEQEERHQLDLSAVCYKRASSALSTLRNFEVDNVSQMVDCLTLGGLCVTIAMKLGPSQIALISNKTLEMIRPIYNQQDVVDPDRLALLTCLIFTDLEDSLIRCRLPTLRYKLPNDRQYVDRYVGLCHSLLPHLHDIAEFATALRHADDTDVLSIHQALVSVAESVIDWRSSPPTDLLKRFSGAEVSHLICQEHVLRAMALLIIHRLCHPFGVADEQAQLMANQILAQLESTAQITGSLTLLTELALFAACMELRQGDHRFDRMCLWLKGDEQLRDRLTAGMEFVRATRDASGTVYWHDLGVIVGNL
ncbi:hypothetical protein K461DRAFT_276928 [Myriangium duriaei CBS 260.36]|uniref:Uncharacterized protein n=1 Tax=Myriangium duriaei CBS 260.36 TaxID=1168546 RepID=A0A9P4J4D1_9PEZI|nr:hypothetical protein K461DRAFT_276928 [Myriangium duriaei CBS 260.36]